MKTSIIEVLTATMILLVCPALLINKFDSKKETNKLQEKLIEKDEYIEQYIQTIYYLKDEFILNETNEKYIHKLDSISYIYEYLLSGEDESLAKKLSKRAFSNADKRIAYERQDGICPKCGEHHTFEEMDGDHIIPWWRGGKTTLDNLQMLCNKCNKGKGGKME